MKLSKIIGFIILGLLFFGFTFFVGISYGFSIFEAIMIDLVAVVIFGLLFLGLWLVSKD